MCEWVVSLSFSVAYTLFHKIGTRWLCFYNFGWLVLMKIMSLCSLQIILPTTVLLHTELQDLGHSTKKVCKTKIKFFHKLWEWIVDKRHTLDQCITDKAVWRVVKVFELVWLQEESLYMIWTFFSLLMFGCALFLNSWLTGWLKCASCATMHWISTTL